MFGYRRFSWQKWYRTTTASISQAASTESKDSNAALKTMLAGLFGFVAFSLTKSFEASCDATHASVAPAHDTHGDGASGKATDINKHEQKESSSLTSKYLLTDSYRRRIFFKYERKLRMLSPPEKVFDYFASVKVPDGQKFMTSSDLMRAVVPVLPPSESSLVREGSLPGEQPPGELRCPPSEFFMLFDTNGDGLISFAEYIFLLTLLSFPECSFSAAVRMFDIDGNGTIDREEFQKVMETMRARTRQNARQCDGLRTGLKVDKTVENCGLVEYFFGKDGRKLLKHEDFEGFLKDLHKEIICLEFSHYDYLDRGSISAKDFGLSMVAAADLSLLNHYLDSVDALGNEPSFKDCHVTFEEFHSFAELRKQLEPLALAINSYGKTYGLLTKADFQRAASQVCKVPLTDKVVDIVYYIFDVNKDGNLSTEEFLRVLERREHGILECWDSGIINYLKCWWRCAHSCHC